MAKHQTTFDNKTLTYDNNGNLTSVTDGNGTTLYSWNARNQLVGISGPTVTASFVYDGLGRRQQKTINGNSTDFLYDGVNPVQETSGAAILANILPGLGIDEFLTRTDVVGGTTSNFLTDALGSPIAVTDTAGTVQTEYIYEPFGKTTVTGASNTTTYQYTGRENDGTGLYYYRARYYHPQLQRFISEEPIGFALKDFNLFAYVANKPLSKKDPLGLAPCNDDEECRQKYAECMAHAIQNEIGCMALVASGFAICTAGAGLACSVFGPAGFAVCFAARVAQCAHAADIGHHVCQAITAGELGACYNNYRACLRGG